VLERQARAMLKGLSVAAVSPTFVERARLQVAAGLDRGEVTADDVARRLRVAERTLRRRLGEAGTGYRELLDDVRRERALALAKDPRLSVSQIANQLGFSGATSFGRAFRRWTGVLPSLYARKEREE
jgi:AraC-like DNA-binding protein